MGTWRAFCETIHLVALGLWVGTLAMTGAAAAILFPTIRGLRPTLPDYARYTGEHWLIAAGHVVQRLFLLCDTIQFGCATVASASLAVLYLRLRLEWRRPASFARLGGLLVAMGVLFYQFFFLVPGMNRHLTAYWIAAQTGDNATALVHKAAFDADHPTATGLLVSGTLAVLVALVAGAWSAATPGYGGPAGEPSRAGRPGRLEEPLLARTRP